MGTSKTCTDELNALDIRQLARAGCLIPGLSCTQHWYRGQEHLASLPCTTLGSSIRIHSPAGPIDAPITHTPCHFGGTRPWWRCPHCHRRVAILYLSQTLGCRHCFDLGYRVEREGKRDRALRRAQAIRHRLDWPPGIFGNRGIRPKGMHRRTYKRLRAEHARCIDTVSRELQRQHPELQARTAS